MIKLHRTYPVWLHLLHLTYHTGLFLYQAVGFTTSFQSSTNSISTDEVNGPGWRFRYVTTWILSVLSIYIIAALLYDILLILRGLNDTIIKQFRIHLDRFYCLMFSTSVGMGFFFHLFFFFNCINNHHCPKYTDSLLFIHLMPFWYGLAEFLFVPHDTKRDIKTTPILVFIFCFIYFINYWLFVAQTHGHHPYGDPWPIWQWFVYFCFPLGMLALRLMAIIRRRLFYKRGLRSPCIYPQNELYANPWIGWHFDYSRLDQSEMQPIDWKAIGAMNGILLTLISIWNLVYLVSSGSK
ncbi:unnamed protein product [Adineta ricciae]|uniref:Uncharacterized protein n=1 Tax=Adineta ricciae TaxID=249248 RepID=A0A815CLZ3_ADIRI|nr:unnamed protein product [Adineta ricciae]